MLRTILFMSVLGTTVLHAQVDDRMAYVVTPRPMKGDASSPAIAIRAEVDSGSLVFVLPEDASHADLTNARGRVVAEVAAWPDPRIDARRLKPGTYMLRAYTPNGILLKRLVLLRPGGGIWLTDAPTR